MPQPTGLTAAASALRYWERRQEVAANNLANVSTDGFKGERVFAKLLGDQTTVAQSATDLTQGTIRETRNPLDLAVRGDAFFVVDTPNGERFSRGGSFSIDTAHRLVDPSGHPVLGTNDRGESGPITVPNGEVDIAKDGTVRSGAAVVGKLRLEHGGKGASLAHEGGTLFVPDANRQKVADAERDVRQGVVEESNVNSVSSMVDMIAVQRAYASVQKAVTTIDAVRGMAVNEIGKPV
jgi:flagellar basal-body rod protein FlgF